MCEVPVVPWSRSRLWVVPPGLSSLRQLSAWTDSLLRGPAAFRSASNSLSFFCMNLSISPSAACTFYSNLFRNILAGFFPNSCFSIHFVNWQFNARFSMTVKEGEKNHPVNNSVLIFWDTGSPYHVSFKSQSTKVHNDKPHLGFAPFVLSGARVNAGRGSDSPLHAAVRLDCDEQVSLLLEFGADVNLRDDKNQRALDLAPPGGDVHQLLKTFQGKACVCSTATTAACVMAI